MKLKENLKKLGQNPYKTKNIKLKGSKCPHCKRIKSENYRIIYKIHTKLNKIEIVRIIERKKDYREF